MTKSTELLLRITLVVVIVFVGWQLAVQSVVGQLQANARAAQAEARCPPQ